MRTDKRILILSSEFPPLPGGIGNQAYNLAKHLGKVYEKVTVITDQRGTLQEEDVFDAAQTFNVIRIPTRHPRFLMYLKRVSTLLGELKTHDVLIATGKFSLWLGAFVGLWAKQKTIAIIHGTEVNFKHGLLKASIDWALPKFDRVIAVSKFTKKLVEHMPLKMVRVIPNGYDPEVWSLSKKEPVILKGQPKLLTVGRVSERKGQWQVIKHLPTLLKKYPKLHYHCVGLPQDTEACLELARDLGVAQHITMHGMLPHQNLKTIYPQIDIAVMLSQTTASGDVEGFGIALLEANHYGVPSIGSLGCGIEEAIAMGQSGQVIDSKNANEFAQAIQDILNHKEKYTAGAKAWAEQHQWQRIIKAYIKEIEA